MSTVIITLPSVPTVVTCLAAASTVHAWVALLSSMGTLGFMSFSIREKGSLYTRYHYISRSRSCCIFQSRVRNMHRTSKHITNGRLSTATIRSSVHHYHSSVCAILTGGSRYRGIPRFRSPVSNIVVRARYLGRSPISCPRADIV